MPDQGSPAQGLLQAEAVHDTQPPPGPTSAHVLICRVGPHLCALPMEHVVETMRPLPVEPVPDAPAFVMGVSVIRGATVPVVDVAALLSAGNERPSRLVTVRAGERTGRVIALAVSAVGVAIRLSPELTAGLPPLLGEARPGLVSSIGVLDSQALMTLQSAFMLPDDLWAQLGRAGAVPPDATR